MDYNSWKPEDTFEIARQLGEKAVAGDVFCLIGDLGVGKTLFSQGFATGLGIQESVNSPTFTIVQEYDIRRGCLPDRVGQPDRRHIAGALYPGNHLQRPGKGI